MPRTATGSPIKQRRRWWARFAGVMAGLAVGLAILVSALVWRVLPPTNSTLALPGLSAPVQIIFDQNGIPFIRAASPVDAAEALGYVHARDRMFQMDLMRRAAGGSLAQLFGAAALDNDEEMRRLGMRRSAEADVTDLSPGARAELQAYANGVNAWISQRGRFAAPEFILLGRPAPWTIPDSLLWGKMMGLWLSGNWRLELERLALSAQQPRNKIDALWPPIHGIAQEEAALASPDSSLAAAATGTLGWMRHFPQPFTLPAQASNEWAVAGARTASGKPLLAGDPHLAFGFPSLWYLVRIDTPEGTLAGATAPGIPFMVIGRNSHIAWTFTTTGAAVQDVFIEHPTLNGTGYETPTGPQPFITRIEHIPVRGQADTRLTITETRHGPIIGTTPDGKSLLSVEMANLAPHDTDSNGLLLLSQAQSVADAGIAAAQITSPVQNLLVADTADHIGFFTTGRVPIRRAGDGAWPVDGADGLHDWTGVACGAALPHSINPPSNMLLNANNPTAPANFPVFMGRDTYGDWRARRIEALLNASNHQTPETFRAIQQDITSNYAQRILPRLLAVPMAPGSLAAQAQALLAGWSGDMAANLPQPLIFNAWEDEFVTEILQRNHIDEDEAPLLTDSFIFSLLGPDAATATQSLWCNGNCSPLLRGALSAASATLARRYGNTPADWRWGTAHKAIFAHPLLGNLPLIDVFARFSISAEGDATSINVAAPGPSAQDPDGFTAIHGPELRAIYDLSNLDQSLFIIAPGQSGDLLAPNAGNLLTRWESGQYLKLPAKPSQISATIIMVPAPKP